MTEASDSAGHDKAGARERLARFTSPSSLRGRLLLIVSLIYIVVGSVALFFFLQTSRDLIQQLGVNFAIKSALWQNSRVMSRIRRETALALKLADSPILRRWCRQEDDPATRSLAMAELESFRRAFADHSYFFVVDRSRHYYFNNAENEYQGKELQYVLDPGKAADRWYFETMGSGSQLALNVDRAEYLSVTKVWFNAVVQEGTDRVGMGGSGVDVTDFIREIITNTEEGVETILLDEHGVLQAHRNPAYMEHNTKTKDESKKITIYQLLGSQADVATLTTKLERLAKQHAQVETFTLTVEGQTYLAAASSLKEIHWFNLVLVDVSRVLSLRQFAPLIGLLFLSLLVVLVVIAAFLNRIVLTPLARLTRSTQEIAAGNYAVELPELRSDEIGRLTRSFNHMTATVREYTGSLESKVKVRTEELSVSNQKLAESNKQIMDSIHYAMLIQSSILPKEAALSGRLDEFFVLYRPRDIVGGDFYFFLDAGDGFFLAVVDCTGHGVPGAFMAMTASAVLRQIVPAGRRDDPGGILRELNRVVRATVDQESGDPGIDVGLDIGLCSYIREPGKLIFAGARIDLYHALGGVIHEIRGGVGRIGYRGSDPDLSVANHAVDVRRGMTFYMTTDGLLDQAGGAKMLGFGRRRFVEMLRKWSDSPLVAQKAAYEGMLAEYQGEARQRDDITFVGFRI